MNHVHDAIHWHCHWRLDKYQLDGTHEVLEGDGNLLTTNGANALLTALTGGAITAFNNANSNLGVGDGNGSVPTPAAGDIDLTAPTNKLRKAMDAAYPAVTTNSATFRSTFGSTDANWVWNEWGIFNASSAGTMLNHKGQGMGTKVSGATWQLSVTVSLA